MGLVYKKILTRDTLLGLWEINESVPELLSIANLSPFDKTVLSKKKNDRRKKEWLAARCLAKDMLVKPSEIVYDRYGKPILQTGDYNISISHSEKYSTVYLNKESPAGVDVQKIKRDIGKGIDYFLNNHEHLWIDPTDLILLNILWSSKESAFKYISSNELDIKNQIDCSPFVPEPEGIVEVTIRNKDFKTIAIHYELFEDYVLTRTL